MSNRLLRDSFQINKSIVANQAALDEAQAEYDSLVASAIIEGLITLIATIGAIASLVAGEGPLAVELGLTAGENFAKMIADAVAANKLPA